MCFAWISERTAGTSLYSFSGLVFVHQRRREFTTQFELLNYNESKELKCDSCKFFVFITKLKWFDTQRSRLFTNGII